MTQERSSVDNTENTRISQTDQWILARVAQSCVVNFHSDEIVYVQGDHAVFVFFVLTGTVKVTVPSEDGREAVVRLYLSEDLFGEECWSAPPK